MLQKNAAVTLLACGLKVCLSCGSDLLENGGFVCLMSHKVRTKGGGKGPSGVSAGVKSGLANVLRSPNPYARCRDFPLTGELIFQEKTG